MAPRRLAAVTSLAAALTAASGLMATGVSAHVGHVIRRAERYIKLDVEGYRARVVLSLTLGPDEGRRVLLAADENGDGAVTRTEADVYLAQWSASLQEELPIRLDEAALTTAWGEPYFEPIGAVRAVPLTLEVVARFPLEGGDETVTIVDRMVRREVFERTDVAFQIRGGAVLVQSGVGELEPVRAVTPPPTALTYNGDHLRGQEVPLIAIVRTEPRVTPHTLRVAGGAVVFLLAVTSLLVWVRRKR